MELNQIVVEVCVDIEVDGPVNLFALLEQAAQRFPERGALAADSAGGAARDHQ